MEPIANDELSGRSKPMGEDFEVIGTIEDIQTIAIGNGYAR
jgi:hypothetical protein